jgi:hypothetical protein
MQIQFYITYTRFGIIYAILREFHTKISNLLKYNKLLN